MWTATDPPLEALVEMVGAWEFETGPITRWWLPVRPAARVFEIHRLADWARLTSAHPSPAAPHPGWELPGVNQHHTEISSLLASAEQRAVRLSVRHHVVPDWQSVAGQYDGIHLSWAGFITTEGCIVDLGGGDVTMLRYWFSERTLWLADVFDEPHSAPDPYLDDPSRHRTLARPRLTRPWGSVGRVCCVLKQHATVDKAERSARLRCRGGQGSPTRRSGAVCSSSAVTGMGRLSGVLLAARGPTDRPVRCEATWGHERSFAGRLPARPYHFTVPIDHPLVSTASPLFIEELAGALRSDGMDDLADQVKGLRIESGDRAAAATGSAPRFTPDHRRTVRV